MLSRPIACGCIVGCAFFASMFSAKAQHSVVPPDTAAPQTETDSPKRQAELEAVLVEMLSGATLEGSFTSTGPGRDLSQLHGEKYTLGDVKKLGGNLWLIPARIQYGEHDVTLPIPVPIHWAKDTPVVVIDDLGLPGFGTVSARVMFFADHYAGYWKHGDRGGHLFGIIRRAEKKPTSSSSRRNPPAAEQKNQESGQQQAIHDKYEG